METIIKIKLVDSELSFIESPVVPSGGVNTIVTEFMFDDNWTDFIKTAVFYRDNTDKIKQVLDGNQCYVPKEVMATHGRMYFGVFGVKDDKVKTSQIAFYDITNGTLTTGTITDPTASIWQQILEELGGIRDLAEQIKQEQETFINEQNADREEYQNQLEERVDGSIQEAKNATKQCYDAISALNLEIYDMDGGDPFTQASEDDVDVNGGYPV